ncbi:tetratricopeptide repeat protein [Micromonospora ureilytica]|uniref:Tetratricopeptide (TPR) repeat protein n=1 Tax=Micromonospora ureilytica TaxID=709868 RepID=A0ABS0JDM0_9ACTN|nr:tetratricopeptide repeat protein [Micromonospora ureilytica]MBG6064448.1 tetratricopeptide (TPR) repeat protein [Micromonospora ureilytica]WSR55892.1 tetratricopeptide repeat protein [Micromonospora ureilytica]
MRGPPFCPGRRFPNIRRSDMTFTHSRVRRSFFTALNEAHDHLDSENPGGTMFLAVTAPDGSGKLETVRAWRDSEPDRRPGHLVLTADGNRLTHGYLSGLQPLVDHAIATAETDHPDLVSAAEQSLKRIFPHRQSPAFRMPKDLTGVAGRDERTRFYYHDYQGKLLNGVYEFLDSYLATTGQTCTLIIDNADELSPTVTQFLDIMARRRTLGRNLKIVLLVNRDLDVGVAEHSVQISLPPLSRSEARELIESWGFDSPAPKQLDNLWRLSQGRPARLSALLRCADVNVSLPGYLTFETHIDLYLSLLGERRRYDLLQEYVQGHCADDDPIARRNYETYDEGARERMHREVIAELDQQEEVLHPVHHLSLRDASDQVVALAPLSISLQEIGLYNTWFDLFSRFWANSQLRTLPGGGQTHNLVYLRMAFVLYSLGLAHVSISYLDTFYQHFPHSLYTPTVLYSQSMAHGRYQSPPDLVTAERFALLNLEKISTDFRDHPKYEYIKVFAENALAYIRARQKRMDEALKLCTDGMDRMHEIYGDDRFALHQSILVYNTAQIHEMLKDYTKAYEVYQQTIALDPNYGEYANDLANMLQRIDRFDEAIEYYERAIALCPPYYEAHLNRAQMYVRMADPAAAEADFRRAVELNPDEARAHLGLGILQLKQSRFAEAQQSLDAAVYHNPRNALAWTNRGLTLLELGRTQEAEESLRTALAHNNKLAEAWNNLAHVLHTSGRKAEALECLDAAVRLSDDPDYVYNRALLRHELGDTAGALADVELAAQSGADATEVADLREQVTKTPGIAAI